MKVTQKIFNYQTNIKCPETWQKYSHTQNLIEIGPYVWFIKIHTFVITADTLQTEIIKIKHSFELRRSQTNISRRKLTSIC